MNAEGMLIRLAEARKRVKFSAGSNGREILFVGDVNGIFEFNNTLCEAIKLGEELRPKGQWVDFDPATATFDCLPITGKASNNGSEWYENELIGYIKRDHHPFVTDVLSYKFFQVWEAGE